jgi:hypothetical protein
MHLPYLLRGRRLLTLLTTASALVVTGISAAIPTQAAELEHCLVTTTMRDSMSYLHTWYCHDTTTPTYTELEIGNAPGTQGDKIYVYEGTGAYCTFDSQGNCTGAQGSSFATEVWLGPDTAVWIMGGSTRCWAHDVDQPGVITEQSCSGVGADPSVQPAAERQASFWTAIAGSFETKAEADSTAAILKGKGLDADVLLSSDYSSLRPGYWVTFLGHFPDSSDAQNAVEQLRTLGYSDAYTREVKG